MRSLENYTFEDGFEPTDQDLDQRNESRAAYVAKIMKCFADEAAQAARKDPAMDFDDVVKAVAE